MSERFHTIQAAGSRLSLDLLNGHIRSFDVTLDGGPPLPDAPADAPGDSTRDSFIAPDGGCPASAPTQCGAVCVDITSDDQHCNGCNKACAANQRCNNSTCGCRPNYDDCDNNASNGCEAKLDSDQHCGACGNSCGNGASCSSGSCQCQSGRQNCDGTFSNGCECTTGCDGSNCKAVGCNPSTAGACGGSSSYCDNGTCRTCAAGFYNCDGTGGCECTYMSAPIASSDVPKPPRPSVSCVSAPALATATSSASVT